MFFAFKTLLLPLCMQQLELQPGTRLEQELSALVDRQRFLRSAAILDDHDEVQIQQILDNIVDTCVKRGLLVRYIVVLTILL